MKTISAFLFSAALLIQTAYGATAKFPQISLGGTTNIISDNGTAVTRNGVAIGSGGGGNWVAVGSTNSTLAGNATIGGGKPWVDVTALTNFFGDGVHDDAPALNAVVTNLPSGGVIFLPSTVSIVLSNTWYIHGKDSIKVQGQGRVYYPSIQYRGPAAGVAIDVDKTSNSEFCGFKLYSGDADTAINIDKVDGAISGNTTGLLFHDIAIDSGTLTDGRISRTNFVGVYISKVSTVNCENIRLVNVTIACGPDLNNSSNGYGLRIGASANAKDIRFEDGFIGYANIGMWSRGAGLIASRNLHLGNMVDYLVEGANNTTFYITDNVSEAQRQYFVAGTNEIGNSVIVLARNTINSGAWITNVALIEARNSVKLVVSENTFTTDGTAAQQVFTNSAPTKSPQLFAVGNWLPHDDDTKFGLSGFTAGWTLQMNSSSRSPSKLTAFSDPLRMPSVSGANIDVLTLKTNAGDYTVLGPSGSAVIVGSVSSPSSSKLRVYGDTTNGVVVAFDDPQITDRFKFLSAANGLASTLSVKANSASTATVQASNVAGDSFVELQESSAGEDVLFGGGSYRVRSNGTNYFTADPTTATIGLARPLANGSSGALPLSFSDVGFYRSTTKRVAVAAVDGSFPQLYLDSGAVLLGRANINIGLESAGQVVWADGNDAASGTADAGMVRDQVNSVRVTDGGSGTGILNTRYSMGVGSAVTLTSTNRFYLVNVDAQTVTLPTAVGASGRLYEIKTRTPAVTATIATTSSQLIDGASTYSLTASNKFVRVASDGTNWWVFGNN